MSAIVIVLVVFGSIVVINWGKKQIGDGTFFTIATEEGGGVAGDVELIEALDKICLGVEDTTVTPKFSDKHNLNTAGDDGYSISIWNPLTGTWDEDGTDLAPRTDQTLSPHDKLRILYNSNQTTTGTTYLPQIFETEIPCKGTYKPVFPITDVSGSMLTVTFTNSDGITKNAATAEEDLSAGDANSIGITVRGQNEDQLGVTTNAVCVEYNNTGAFDEISLSGSGLREITKPTRISTGSGSVEPCYEFPLLTKENREARFIMDYDVDDDDWSATSGNLTFTFIGDFGYRDSNDMQYYYGYETNQNGQKGATDETATWRNK
tara:strand:+ start:26163 stop:27122 length:960 start_codon:yes stop_codon:yes gene_type:complete